MIRTKEIIRDAFWELLEEKPYNKITVSVSLCPKGCVPFRLEQDVLRRGESVCR